VWGRYYLPGDVQLSVEAQDLLARIFRPDPKKRIGLAAMRRHPWLQQDTASVLDQAAAALAQPGAPGSAAATEVSAEATPAQSEDGIRDVIHRARQRRLRRLTATSPSGGGGGSGGGGSGGGGYQSPDLARTSHQLVAVAASS